jgi:hypothetical protein
MPLSIVVHNLTLNCFFVVLFFFLFFDGLGPPVTQSESIWNYERYRELEGLLGLGISPPQGRYLHNITQAQENADIRPCLDWVSKPRPSDRAGEVFRALHRTANVVRSTSGFYNFLSLVSVDFVVTRNTWEGKWGFMSYAWNFVSVDYFMALSVSTIASIGRMFYEWLTENGFEGSSRGVIEALSWHWLEGLRETTKTLSVSASIETRTEHLPNISVELL